MKYNIMIVEDDSTIAGILSKSLKKWNYEVHIVKDFQSVMEDFANFQPHLVLMDVTLPYYNGYHWCQQIRKISKVPVLFLSSASENMSMIMAMNMGADDYVTKPFDREVLEAKILALLRRAYDFSSETQLIEHQGLVLNLLDMSVSYSQKSAELTKNEFKILEVLLKNKGKVISRDELMIRLWQSDEFVDDNTLTVNIARLRKTLSNLGIEEMIKTKKAVGYYVSQ